MIIVGQIVLTILTVICPWLVLTLTAGQNFSLQFFSLLVIAFVLLARWQRRQPSSYKTEVSLFSSLKNNFQVALMGMGILLMIGNTGGFGSWLLSLFFIFYFFQVFEAHLIINLLSLVLSLFFIYFFTPDFSQAHYGAIVSLLVFAPFAIFAQKYYRKAVQDNWQLQMEREKVTYYNLYAEKQQNELLRKAVKTGGQTQLLTFLQGLIPQIDNLQKESRFPQNQLIISAQLTKIGLALRQVVKKGQK